MHIDYLRQVFERERERDALVWRDRAYSYGWMLQALDEWRAFLDKQAVAPSAVVSLEADFSPNAIALLLALIDRSCVIVPLTGSVESKKPEFREKIGRAHV